jgi:hypothetical protein
MKPTFAALKKNHDSSNSNSPDFKDKKDVYREIGYDYDKLYTRNNQYEPGEVWPLD